MNSNSQNRLIRMLADSQIYKDYERAFGETTGLPLNLSPVEHWQLAHHGRRHENPFCAIVAQSNKACAACLRAQQQTCDPAACEPRSVMCFAGLYETSVPLRVGENLIGLTHPQDRTQEEEEGAVHQLHARKCLFGAEMANFHRT